MLAKRQAGVGRKLLASDTLHQPTALLNDNLYHCVNIMCQNTLQRNTESKYSVRACLLSCFLFTILATISLMPVSLRVFHLLWLQTTHTDSRFSVYLGE